MLHSVRSTLRWPPTIAPNMTKMRITESHQIASIVDPHRFEGANSFHVPGPLCNVPVAFRPGQDPNDRMEEHFNTDCTVMTGKAAKSKSPVCARASCKKVLFSPISCDKCRRQFCPAHRFPSDHNCTSATSQPAAPGRQAAQSNLLAKFDAKAINAKATGAVDALKKTIPTSSASSQTPAPRPAVTANSSSIASSSKPKPSSPSATNVFSKTDRRAKAERESQIKAMQERAKKGLLSDADKAKLAALEAEKKDNCIVM
ncbi:hypothetical protein AX16_008072 [Volvariella volvacea WC 439]|nr:hypothetical protein AX16_008072 [Volvariella volvacea WC 439]